MQLQVQVEQAGKRGRCPQCKNILQIPAANAPPAAAMVAAPPSPAPAVNPALAAAPQALPGHGVPFKLAPPAQPASQHIAPHPAAPQQHAPTPLRPPANAQSPPAGGNPIRVKVMESFVGSFERVQVTSSYILGLCLATGVMLVVLTIYLGLILAGAYGLYVILTAGPTPRSSRHNDGVMVAFLFRLFLAGIGMILLLFMVKPLFAPRGGRERTRILLPQNEPLLFEFVGRVCGMVGAPVPSRIDVTCDINAGASLRRGLFSFLSNDLVLTVGMPLVAGLSLQQFAGVMAHEFGHFSQTAGMRLTYLLRSLNLWFMRIVYERDSWDEWLERASDSIDLRIGWIFYLVRGLVWLSRKILSLLLYAGNLVVGYMLRQMEFDADKYEARMAGSSTFAHTCRQLRMLGVAWEGARSDVSDYFREGRLVDNLPRLMVVNVKQLPAEVVQTVDELITNSETSLFDSHPADKDRISSAWHESAPGAFRSELPATVLFADFETTSKMVTWDFYYDIFGPELKREMLHPLADLLARQDADQAASEATKRFFMGAFNALRPLLVPGYSQAESGGVAALRDRVLAARQRMLQCYQQQKQAFDKFDEADTHLLQSHQAYRLWSVHVQPKGDAFDRYYGSANEANQVYQQAEAHMQWLGQYLQPFEDAAGHRLYATLMLLYEPEAAARVPQAAAMQAECARLLPVLRQVTSAHAAMLNLRNVKGVLEALLHHAGGQENNGAFGNMLVSYVRHLREELLKLRGQFDAFPYPFDHAQGAMSISHYLLKELPGPEEFGDIIEGADRIISHLLPMYGRTVGRLCLMAEGVETALGQTPLPTPAEPPKPGVPAQVHQAPIPNPYGAQPGYPQQPGYAQAPPGYSQPGYQQPHPSQAYPQPQAPAPPPRWN
jgi:hypothetical protein